MGVLERVRTILSASLDDLVDKADNPELRLRRAVLEGEELLRELAHGARRQERYAEHLSARVGELKGQERAWAERAREAVSDGNDDLARAALRRRIDALNRVARTGAERDDVLRVKKQMDRDRFDLERRLVELKRRHAAVGASAPQPPGPAGPTDAPDERVEEELRRMKDELSNAGGEPDDDPQGPSR